MHSIQTSEEQQMNEIEVKNLTVSFRTNRGLVHAVRDLSFSLEKGETLAIVGESGSGKSVTAKAILGIEDPNAVIESGQIIYDGKDILKFKEEDFYSIRGNRITMIFQDPMSALDPIVKIGPQLTEASILNGKRNQKLALKKLKKNLRELKKTCFHNHRKFKAPEGMYFSQSSLHSDFKNFNRIVWQCRKLSRDFFKKAEKNCNYKIEWNECPEYFNSTVHQNDLEMTFIQSFEKKLEELNVILPLEEISNLIRQSVFHISKKRAYKNAIEIMEEVGINDAEKRFHQYPFEFSGGMRQRIVIAIAIAANPDLLICDEPTTALDVTIQAQILELINTIKKKRNVSIIFITHDLGVVANVADKIAVMYAGKIVEEGTSEDIFYSPAHPYTWALLSSIPDLNSKEKLESIPGNPPDMTNPPKGDAFAPRNKYALAIDFEKMPPMFTISPSHRAASWLLHPSAPKVTLPESLAEKIKAMKEREKNNECSDR